MEEALPIWIPWMLFLVGAALGAPYAVRVFGAGINAAAFAAVVNKLLAAGNADRALKLCAAAGGAAPLAVATRAAIVACGRGITHDPSADYRSAGDLSPERVLAPVRAAYEEAFEALASPIRVTRYLAVAGAGLLATALALTLSRGPSEPGPAVAAFVASATLAWAGVQELRLLASRDATFAAMRDALDALIRNPARVPSVAPPTGVRVGFDVSEPGRAPRVVETGEDVIKIGSLDTAQVCLDAPGVARMHAVVERSEGGAYSVIDLGSDAGTRVNGEPVNRRELSDGDVLTVGEAELRLRIYR